MNLATSSRNFKKDEYKQNLTDTDKTKLAANHPLRNVQVLRQSKATCKRYLRDGIVTLSHVRCYPTHSLQTYMFTAIDPNAVTTPLIGHIL